jgi:hypothetical protein
VPGSRTFFPVLRVLLDGLYLYLLRPQATLFLSTTRRSPHGRYSTVTRPFPDAVLLEVPHAKAEASLVEQNWRKNF